MSGEPVALFGPAMEALVGALPEVEAIVGQPIVLVGGLAVLARLGSAYRVTSDIDTVDEHRAGERGQLEVLLASGARPTDAAGALVTTSAGEVRVDVLEVSVEQLGDLPSDATDRLYLLAHDWAMRTATPLELRTNRTRAVVRTAEPGPLIATKLQALPNRTAAKEATDLLDIVRLTLDDRTGQVVRDQLSGANPQLRADAALHVRKWFMESAERSVRLIGRSALGEAVRLDTVMLVGELLLAVLSDIA